MIIIETRIGEKHMQYRSDSRLTLRQVFSYEKMISLYAEGEDLDHIIAVLPMLVHKKGNCVWKGEMAQFIYDNAISGQYGLYTLRK